MNLLTNDNGAVRELRQLLKTLEGEWRRLGAPIGSQLRPGISEEEMDALTEPHGFRLPLELRVWWNWHDGAHMGEPARDRSIGPGSMQFLSLAEALTDLTRNLQVHGEPDEPELFPEVYWHPTWLPFMSRDAHRLFIDCLPQPRGGAYSRVGLVSWEWDDFDVPRFHSLSHAVSLWIWILQSDFYRWDGSAVIPHWAHGEPQQLPIFARAAGVW